MRATLNSFFERVVCINLPRRQDRRARFLDEMGRHGFHADIGPGVDGKSIDCRRGRLSSGRLGCLRSHRAVLQNALAGHWDSVLVLEDDVLFIDDMTEVFSGWCSEIPSRWELFYVGWLPRFPVNILPVSANVNRIWNALGTHAVAVRRPAYEFLIGLLSREDQPADFCFVSAQSFYGAYGFRLSLASQANTGSDTQEAPDSAHQEGAPAQPASVPDANPPP